MPRLLRNLNASAADWSDILGSPYVGVLGSLIPTTGEHGGGYAASSVEPEDANKEIRGLVTTWPTLGTLFAFEDTSFTYDGESDTFAWQMYVDGVAVGSPQTVTITVGAEHALDSTSSEQRSTSDAGALTQTHVLGGANSEQPSAATSGAVDQSATHILGTAASSQPSSAASGAIAQTHILAGANSEQPATTTSGALESDGAHTLAALDSEMPITVSAGAIQQTHILGGANSIQPSIARAGAISDGSVPAFDLRGSVFARIPARYDAFTRIAARSDVFARIQ